MSTIEALPTLRDDVRRAKLKEALTRWRSRLQPGDVGLRSTTRRRVAGLRREEIAELVGVSSDWYRWFESGRPIRVSLDFIGRVADALLLDDDERATLFSLASPEVATAMETSLRAQSEALLDSISGVGKFARRVWTAGSVLEILATLADTVAERFVDGEMIGVYRRLQPGRWEYPVVLDRARLPCRTVDFHLRLRDGLTPEQIDESMLHQALCAPGDVSTWREALRSATVKRRVDSALEEEGFNHADLLAARVDSRDGVEATVFVSYLSKAKVFSEFDRVLLSALAEIASLAARRSNSVN